MAAFETIAAKTSAPLFIFADHASRHIPARLKSLGLKGEDLTRHIAYDIGTEGLIRGLCKRFGSAGHIASVSRLVIDCNRDPSAKGLIPTISDGTSIPGNMDISRSEKARRLKDIHAPYHAGLSTALETVAQETLDPLIVSLHSFTPKLKFGGPFRLTEIGLLYKTDDDSALAAQECFMRMGRNFTIGMNAPYSAFDLNYTVDVHVTPRGLRHVTFEVRQDLIDNPEKVADMTGVLETVIAQLIYRRHYPVPITP